MFTINQVDIQWIFDTCNITVPKYFLSQPIHVFEKKGIIPNTYKNQHKRH